MDFSIEELERDDCLADIYYDYTQDQKMVAELKQDIGKNPYQE